MQDSIQLQTPPAVGATGTGDAGATVESPAIIEGVIKSIGIKYLLTPPAGSSDVVIATAGVGDQPVQTILTLTNAATDRTVYPRQDMHDDVGAVEEADDTEFRISDKIVVTTDDMNDDDYVVVTINFES